MIRLDKVAEIVGGSLIGNGDTEISGVAGIQEATEGQLSFLASSHFIQYLPDCKASAIIIGNDIDKESLCNMNAIVAGNPVLAFAKAAEALMPARESIPGISPLAFIGRNVTISESACISPFSYIGDGSFVDDNAIISPHVYIGNNVIIGESTVLYPNVTIYGNSVIGKRVFIHAGSSIGSDGFGYIWDGKKHFKIPQLGTVEIEDDVEIGSNVSIDRASLGKTIIKKGTKIDNLVQIAHNVHVGDNTIIVAQVGIAGSVTIGSNVILAGQVGVRDHISIGNNVKAGGGTGITKSVPDNAVIAGNPHQSYRDWLKTQTYLKKLPRLFQKMKILENKLHLEANDD